MPGAIVLSKKRNWYFSYKWVVIVYVWSPSTLNLVMVRLFRGFSQDSRTDQGETGTTLKIGMSFAEARAAESLEICVSFFSRISL